MRERPPQRWGRVRDSGKVPGERVVEIELPLVPQPHHRRRGERLRDRGDRVLGVWRRLELRLDVREPDRLGPRNLADAEDGG